MLTGAHELPNGAVLHGVGPVGGRDVAAAGLGSVRLVRFVPYGEAARCTAPAVVDRLRAGG